MAEEATLVRTFTSLIAVKSKMGELDALECQWPEHVEAVQPLVEITPTFNAEMGSAGVKKLVKLALRLAEHYRVLMVDCSSWLPSDHPLRLPGSNVLDFLVSELTGALRKKYQLFADEHMPMIPVVDVTDTSTLEQVERIDGEIGCGTGLRVGGLFTRSLEGVSGDVAAALERLSIPSESTDLVLDAGYVESIDTPGVALDSAADLVDRVTGEHTWRSVTLLSGSIPQKRSVRETETVGRPEVELWRRLTRNQGARILYGDYGVVHPEPSYKPPPRFPVWTNPYLFYTIPNSFRYFIRSLKGSPRSVNEGASVERFQDLSREWRKERSGEKNQVRSWGDQELRSCAGGDKKAGSSRRWIAIGTSHHIAHLAAGGDELPYDDRADDFTES